MEKVFPSHAESLSHVRAYVSNTAGQLGVPGEDRRDLALAVSEAFANAVTHADTDRIRVTIGVASDRLMVSVRDGGLFRWRGPTEGGYGIPLMVGLTDELRIDGGTPQRPGTVVRLVKRVSRPEA